MATCTEPTQVQARWDPGAEREKWTWAPIPNQEASYNWHLLAKEKKIVFSRTVSLVYWQHIRTGLRPGSSCPVQIKRKDTFLDLSNFPLSVHFLCYWCMAFLFLFSTLWFCRVGVCISSLLNCCCFGFLCILVRTRDHKVGWVGIWGILGRIWEGKTLHCVIKNISIENA